MLVLLLLIITDIIMGTLCAGVRHDLTSSIGLLGLIKHSSVVLLVLVFRVISSMYGLGAYLNIFIAFYIIQYVLSILETAYCIGVPIPRQFVVRLRDYQQKEGLEKWEKEE